MDVFHDGDGLEATEGHRREAGFPERRSHRVDPVASLDPTSLVRLDVEDGNSRPLALCVGELEARIHHGRIKWAFVITQAVDFEFDLLEPSDLVGRASQSEWRGAGLGSPEPGAEADREQREHRQVPTTKFAIQSHLIKWRDELRESGVRDIKVNRGLV